MSRDSSLEEFVTSCHCGRVRAKFLCSSSKVIGWDCDCSDCFKRRNVHVIIPARDFTLAMTEPLEDATILYQWGTKTAVRRFCKTCGILPWYQPRSNPDGFGVSVHCVDWTKNGTVEPPRLEIKKFNGVEWERTIHEMKEGKLEVNIAEQSR